MAKIRVLHLVFGLSLRDGLKTSVILREPRFRVSAPSCQNEPVIVVQSSGLNASWATSTGIFPDMSNWEKTLG